jgi:hypothetical protein
MFNLLHRAAWQALTFGHLYCLRGLKVVSVFIKIRAFNCVSTFSARIAQINNLSDSARITLSAGFKNAGGSAFVRRWFRVQKAMQSNAKKAVQVQKPNKRFKPFASLSGTACRSPLT